MTTHTRTKLEQAKQSHSVVRLWVNGDSRPVILEPYDVTEREVVGYELTDVGGAVVRSSEPKPFEIATINCVEDTGKTFEPNPAFSAWGLEQNRSIIVSLDGGDVSK